MTRITKEELLEKIFNDDYEHLKGKKLRMTRVRVPGKEVCLAHIINTSQTPVYQNLGLHIGVHEGGGSHRRIHWSDPFYPMGSSCRCCGCGNEKRRCRNWIYGSLLRFPHFNRRPVTGTDRGGRSRSIFS